MPGVHWACVTITKQRLGFGLLALCTAGFLAACGSSDAAGDGDGGGGGGGNGDGGGGNGEFIDAAVPQSCKKIDLVFSVDPSGSMSQELAAMSSDVFPAFATALRTVGDGLEDYRVAVIDGCPTPANFHTRGQSNSDCGFESGEVWMDSASGALEDEFSCVGDIYKASDCSGDNDDEQPIGAAIASLSAPFSTGENAGLLVVVTITDEDECPTFPNCNDTSDTKATEIFDSLVAVKGDVRKMVYLGIGGGAAGCPDSGAEAGAYGAADPAVLTNKISQLFVGEERGVTWDLCDGRLEDGLTEAIEVIEQACRDFPIID